MHVSAAHSISIPVYVGAGPGLICDNINHRDVVPVHVHNVMHSPPCIARAYIYDTFGTGAIMVLRIPGSGSRHRGRQLAGLLRGSTKGIMCVRESRRALDCTI